MSAFQKRCRNAYFWLSIAMAVFTPIFAYMGITPQEVTTWPKLGEIILSAIKNPYVVILMLTSACNAFMDPTKTGLKDQENLDRETLEQNSSINEDETNKQ